MAFPARFHDIRNKAIKAVDAVFAEPIAHVPLKDGRVDPDRARRDIEAVLRVGEGANSNVSGGYAASWPMRIEAGKGQLHVDRASYPDLVIRAGDSIRATSRTGEPWFNVVAVDDRGGFRLLVELTEG